MKNGFIKCAVCSPEIKVADVDYNAGAILKDFKTAADSGAEIVVFPELCVTGFTCGDLFQSDILISAAEKSVEDIAQKSKELNAAAFIGFPFLSGGKLYDAVAVINGGEVVGIVPKTSPDGVQQRWFSPASFGMGDGFADICGESVPFGCDLYFELQSGYKVGVEVGSDSYLPVSPSAVLSQAGVNIIVNCFAGEENAEINHFSEFFKNKSALLRSGYILSDAGVGESTTDCVYSGRGLIIENGEVIAERGAYSTDITCAELDGEYLKKECAKNPDGGEYDFVKVPITAENGNDTKRTLKKLPFIPVDKSDYSDYAERVLSIQTQGLVKRIKHTGAKTLVVGLSGGLDSTLAAIVAVRAAEYAGLGSKSVITITMPCFGTTSRTYDNSVALAKSLNTTLKKISIAKAVERHLKDIKHEKTKTDAAFENSQARERTQVLMDIANMYGGIVVGTGDLSESALGWATYNGDHMCNYNVNCSVPKTLVRFLVGNVATQSKGKLKSVLFDILDTPVSPELIPPEKDAIAQKTEDIVGPYILHDFFLHCYIKRGMSPSRIYTVAVNTFNGDFDGETILKWLKLFFKRFFAQQFKRSCSPDGVKVGSFDLSPRGNLIMPSDASAALWLADLDKINPKAN